jgi:hypothetical protein
MDLKVSTSSIDEETEKSWPFLIDKPGEIAIMLDSAKNRA